MPSKGAQQPIISLPPPRPGSLTTWAMMNYYNTSLADGKWHNFELQPHIDYGDVARYGPNAPWQEPELNNVAIPDVIFPAVQRIQLPAGAELGVAIDGSSNWWPGEQTPAVLPVFSPYQVQPAHPRGGARCLSRSPDPATAVW